MIVWGRLIQLQGDEEIWSGFCGMESVSVFDVALVSPADSCSLPVLIT